MRGCAEVCVCVYVVAAALSEAGAYRDFTHYTWIYFLSLQVAAASRSGRAGDPGQVVRIVQ